MAGSAVIETSSFPASVIAPDPGDKVTGASVRVGEQALACRTIALRDGKITIANGVTMTCASGGTILVDTGGAIVANGSVELNGVGAEATTIAECSSFVGGVGGTVVVNGTTHLIGTTTIDDADEISVDALTVVSTSDFGASSVNNYAAGSISVWQGDVAFLGRKRQRPRVTIADATPVTIDTTQGDEFSLPNAPTAGPPNVVKLRTTTAPIPNDGERIKLVISNTTTALTPGNKYEIQRENGTVIATIAYPTATTNASITAEFIFDSTVWRLSTNSGRNYDGVAILFGVVPGPGA